jgi:hypothetical protein
MQNPLAWFPALRDRVQQAHCGFYPARADLLAPAAHAMLYERGAGRLRSALELPMVDGERPPPD